MAGDAIDANFSLGTMNNLKFEKTGRDAIEISGGRADITTVSIKNSFENGINANQKSIVSVDKLNIEDSEQGVNATDLSKLTINEMNLKGVELGILSFKKLEEYGGGEIVIKNYKATDVKKLHLIEDASTLVLKDKKISKN